MTSTPTSSRKNTTIRIPTMAPVPRPEPPMTEPPPRTSEGQGEGERIRKHTRWEKTRGERGVKKRVTAGERKGFNMEEMGTERKLEKREGERVDEERSQAFNTQHQVAVIKTSRVSFLSEGLMGDEWSPSRQETGILKHIKTLISAFTAAILAFPLENHHGRHT